MKTAVKPDMAKNKGFAEIKKYVQKLYDYSKTTMKWFWSYNMSCNFFIPMPFRG